MISLGKNWTHVVGWWILFSIILHLHPTHAEELTVEPTYLVGQMWNADSLGARKAYFKLLGWLKTNPSYTDREKISTLIVQQLNPFGMGKNQSLSVDVCWRAYRLLARIGVREVLLKEYEGIPIYQKWADHLSLRGTRLGLSLLQQQWVRTTEVVGLTLAGMVPTLNKTHREFETLDHLLDAVWGIEVHERNQGILDFETRFRELASQSPQGLSGPLLNYFLYQILDRCVLPSTTPLGLEDQITAVRMVGILATVPSIPKQLMGRHQLESLKRNMGRRSMPPNVTRDQWRTLEEEIEKTLKLLSP